MRLLQLGLALARRALFSVQPAGIAFLIPLISDLLPFGGQPLFQDTFT